MKNALFLRQFLLLAFTFLVFLTSSVDVMGQRASMPKTSDDGVHDPIFDFCIATGDPSIQVEIQNNHPNPLTITHITFKVNGVTLPSLNNPMGGLTLGVNESTNTVYNFSMNDWNAILIPHIETTHIAVPCTAGYYSSHVDVVMKIYYYFEDVPAMNERTTRGKNLNLGDGDDEIRLELSESYHIAWGICGAEGNPYMNERQADISEDELKVFPNPTSDVLNIELEHQGDVQVELFNSNGMLLKSEKFECNDENCSTKQSLDISDYDAGIYHVVLQTDETRIVKRIIKI